MSVGLKTRFTGMYAWTQTNPPTDVTPVAIKDATFNLVRFLHWRLMYQFLSSWLQLGDVYIYTRTYTQTHTLTRTQTALCSGSCGTWGVLEGFHLERLLPWWQLWRSSPMGQQALHNFPPSWTWPFTHTVYPPPMHKHTHNFLLFSALYGKSGREPIFDLNRARQ